MAACAVFVVEGYTTRRREDAPRRPLLGCIARCMWNLPYKTVEAGTCETAVSPLRLGID